MDTVDKATRSRIMSLVGRKDTGPEIILRLALHKLGLRYRLHDKSLPGSPDLVFPRYRAVVFVHGCYWHCHGCKRSTIPKTRRGFWKSKFLANKERDERNIRLLKDSGWRVRIVWECTVKGKTGLPASLVAKGLQRWLRVRQIKGINCRSSFISDLGEELRKDAERTQLRKFRVKEAKQ